MSKGREYIQAGLGEHMKWHYEYDANDRVTDVYEAVTEAVDGAPCMRTRYTYVGSTSKIDSAKETTATWDSDWDIS